MNKLTPYLNDISTILHSADRPEVARKFETSKQHIYSIRNGKNWGAVT